MLVSSVCLESGAYGSTFGVITAGYTCTCGVLLFPATSHFKLLYLLVRQSSLVHVATKNKLHNCESHVMRWHGCILYGEATAGS